MSDSTNASQLLAAALHGAADVARARLGRDVQVVEADGAASTAILRFDLAFTNTGTLTWYVSNEDATGFSDMLIGGSGDRAAVLTEMHLDALTVAFSDMLTRAVDSLVAGLGDSLDAGEIDLGMEATLPPAPQGGTRVVRALEISDFGPFTIVQQADPELTHFLDVNALDVAAAPAPAGPVPVEQPAAPAEPADNVVPLPAAGAAAPAAAAPAEAPARGRNAERDLELLMNVPLPITVELGQTQRTIRELVDFSIGSIIELGKLAGDPLDIKVNDRTIARGEVVVIDEEFGIRVTEIVSPQERLEGLG